MARALDILLHHDHADPERVAVAGLSGGGWQTIFFSALDTRVTPMPGAELYFLAREPFRPA
jgi:cephalosporin-C deacetylase-like acetyl esterase